MATNMLKDLSLADADRTYEEEEEVVEIDEELPTECDELDGVSVQVPMSNREVCNREVFEDPSLNQIGTQTESASVEEVGVQTSQVSKTQYMKLKTMLSDSLTEFIDGSEEQSLQHEEVTLQHAIFSASMVANLINDLLDLAKLEANTFSFSNENFDLIQVIDNALS